MTSCTLGENGDTKNTFYVVGTAFVDVGEKEPTLGRVLVFSVSDSKYMTCVHQYCRQWLYSRPITSLRKKSKGFRCHGYTSKRSCGIKNHIKQDIFKFRNGRVYICAYSCVCVCVHVCVLEKEPTLGRVLIFSVSDSKYMTCVHQYCRQDIVRFKVSLAKL